MRGLILAALVLCVPAHAFAQEQDVLTASATFLTGLAPLPTGPATVRLPQMMSARGIGFLKSIEGFRSSAYRDIGGGYSIGYGFRTWRGRRVTPAYPRHVTEEEAAAELRRQLTTYEEIVRREFNGNIAQHAFDALVSVCYNVGRVNTSIRAKVRAGRPVGIEDFLTTAVVRSQFSRPLYSRRVREFAMFVGRYEDALDSRLKGWKAARRAHQELARYAVRVVRGSDAVHRSGLADVPAGGETIARAPLSVAPGIMAAARAVPVPLSTDR